MQVVDENESRAGGDNYIDVEEDSLSVFEFEKQGFNDPSCCEGQADNC